MAKLLKFDREFGEAMVKSITEQMIQWVKA
jgi:hypothetical protein